MLVLPTAKILLYIALHVGPQNPHVVYATSNSESYVWTSTRVGWNVEAKGFPSSDFTRDPSRSEHFSGSPNNSSVPTFLREISHYHWVDNSVLVFDNGDRIEKRGDHAFYIINAGAANQKVYTILFPTAGKS